MNPFLYDFICSFKGIICNYQYKKYIDTIRLINKSFLLLKVQHIIAL